MATRLPLHGPVSFLGVSCRPGTLTDCQGNLHGVQARNFRARTVEVNGDMGQNSRKALECAVSGLLEMPSTLPHEQELMRDRIHSMEFIIITESHL